MSLPAQTTPIQTTQDDLEETAPLVVAASALEIDANAETIATEHDVADPIVAIELNFNAFADHCPPTQHAKRVANHLDPSIQDFADQALELATLRAELKRLTRDYEALLRTAKQRDHTIQMLRERLNELRAHSHEPAHAPVQPEPVAIAASEPPACAASPEPVVECSAQDDSAAQNATPTVKLAAPSIDANEIADTALIAPKASPTTGAQLALIPVDHDGDPVFLIGDIITIGRTKRSDVCIPTNAVSRDHARLLVNRGKVTIFDMDSANGCLVNGEPVKRQRLQEGDVLRIGDRSYRLTSNAAAAVETKAAG